MYALRRVAPNTEVRTLKSNKDEFASHHDTVCIFIIRINLKNYFRRLPKIQQSIRSGAIREKIFLVPFYQSEQYIFKPIDGQQLIKAFANNFPRKYVMSYPNIWRGHSTYEGNWPVTRAIHSLRSPRYIFFRR